MPFRLKVFQKGLILVGLPLLVELVLISSLSVLLYQSEQEKLKEAVYRRGAVVMARLIALTVEVPLLVAASIEYQSEKLYQNYLKNIELIKQYSLEADEIRVKCPEIQVTFKEDLEKHQSRVLAAAAATLEKRKGSTAITALDSLIKLSKEMNAVASESSGRLHEMVKHGEDNTRITRQKQELIRKEQSLILWSGFFANLILGFALASFYKLSILNRIRCITGNTIALSRGDEMAAPLTGADEIALVDHAFHDMHKQLKAASEREKGLFENASDVICVLNSRLEFTRVNPISKQHWGFEPEELLGKPISSVLPSSARDRLERKIFEAMNSPEPVVHDSKILSKEKQEKDMQWSIYWSPREQSLFCIVHDVSEQKALERAKAQFLTMISSNLKLPLDAIANSLKRLLSAEHAKELSEQAASKLSSASTNMQRLVELVEDLLLMNEPDFGKIEIRKSTCNVSDILTRSVQNVEGLAEQKKIKLRLEPVDLEWNVDGNRVIQVLVNLLSNAIKFSPAESEVLVSSAQEGSSIICRVTDKGRGIPESKIASVFEKFSQVETADGKRQAGTGLGLPICKQIIEDHGGTIGAQSTEGQGSTFWFRLPILTLEIPKTHPGSAAILAASNIGALHLQHAAAATYASGILPPLPDPVSQGSIFPGKMNLGSKGILLVGIPFICEIALVCCMSVILMQVDRERANELHQRLVSNAASTLTICCVDAQTTMGHDYSELDWKIIKDDIDLMHKTKADLYKLIAKEPSELSYLKKCENNFSFIDQSFEEARRNVEGEKGMFLPFSERHSMIPTLLHLFHSLQRIVEIAEKKEELSPTKQKALREAQWQVLLFGLAANVVSSLVLALYFTRDINSRLMLLADNAQRLANDKNLNNPLAGKDEIAQLDKEFHTTARLLVETRKRERVVFDNSQDIVCVIGQDGRFLSINPACRRILGYGRQEMRERTIFDITCPEDIELTKKALSSENEQLRFSFENRVRRKSGELVDVHWSISRKSGEPMLYCVVHDISARKQLEQLKQDFLGMVSHDLRSPLTAIHGTVQLTAKGNFGEVAKAELDVLHEINQECRALVELISDLLDLEKLEAGKMNLSFEEIELADVLNKSIDSCQEKQKVKLEYTLALDETVVQADFERLTQALANIINYAAAESNDRVRVRLENASKQSQIKIFDSAPRLSEMQMKDFFAHYANVDSNVSARLSLALARSIVERHGGTVSIDSHDAGNLFCLNLPLASDETYDEDNDIENDKDNDEDME